MAEPTVQLTDAQRAWVDALRSGKYEQAQGALAPLGENDEPVGFCCLGVACELANAAGVPLRTNRAATFEGYSRTYDDDAAVLPTSVREWLGLATSSGVYGESMQLTARNDEGVTFAEIADLIEQHADALFVKDVA